MNAIVEEKFWLRSREDKVCTNVRAGEIGASYRKIPRIDCTPVPPHWPVGLAFLSWSNDLSSLG